jgi:hypothetical protein
MALEKMLAEMVAELTRRGATHHVITDHVGHWHEAHMNPGRPLPCPVCFSVGKKNSRLESLPTEDGFQPVRCQACGAMFEFVDAK